MVFDSIHDLKTMLFCYCLKKKIQKQENSNTHFFHSLTVYLILNSASHHHHSSSPNSSPPVTLFSSPTSSYRIAELFSVLIALLVAIARRTR
ncbi:uncharacterized protein DS421_9g286040 [Arachis hypogaea]|nr:uncharacterized protein DS421_9g286040 [Arachis hypogaea]